MAVSNQQKKELLKGLLDSVELDIFRQQMESEALEAELESAEEGPQKEAAQANLENVQGNLARLEARRGAWSKHSESLS